MSTPESVHNHVMNARPRRTRAGETALVSAQALGGGTAGRTEIINGRVRSGLMTLRTGTTLPGDARQLRSKVVGISLQQKH